MGRYWAIKQQIPSKKEKDKEEIIQLKISIASRLARGLDLEELKSLFSSVGKQPAKQGKQRKLNRKIEVTIDEFPDAAA